jgi:hypothetical protein
MHAASIGQFLNKLEYSDKKKSLVAIEQRRACVKKQRRNWFRRPLAAMRQHPDRLDFINQTSVKTNIESPRVCRRASRFARNTGGHDHGHCTQDRLPPKP